MIALLTLKSISDAARKRGVTRNTIYERKEKWNLDELISEIPLQDLHALQGSSLKAAMNLIEDLDSYRPKIRQDASKYILDKAIPQPSIQVTIQNNTTLMPMTDFVAAIKQRRSERTNIRTNSRTVQRPVRRSDRRRPRVRAVWLVLRCGGATRCSLASVCRPAYLEPAYCGRFSGSPLEVVPCRAHGLCHRDGCHAG